MKDVNKSQFLDNTGEVRESVRGKLQYYQELIHQNSKRNMEEGEIEEDYIDEYF